MISLTTCLCDGSFAQDGSGRSDSRVDELDAMIVALANRNPPPKVDNRGAEGAALFDEGYDWAEQDRVLESIRALIKAEGSELWSRLVERMDDKTYSLTYEYDGHVINATVGQLCGDLVLGDLLWPYWQYMPTMKGVSRQGQYYVLWAPQMDLPDGLKAWAWYRSRKGDKLRDLQIEVCNWALKRAHALHEIPEYLLMDGVIPLSDEQKDEVIQKIKQVVKKLQEGSNPIVGTGILHPEIRPTFTPHTAERSKERYQHKLEARKKEGTEKE